MILLNGHNAQISFVSNWCPTLLVNFDRRENVEMPTDDAIFGTLLRILFVKSEYFPTEFARLFILGDYTLRFLGR